MYVEQMIQVLLTLIQIMGISMSIAIEFDLFSVTIPWRGSKVHQRILMRTQLFYDDCWIGVHNFDILPSLASSCVMVPKQHHVEISARATVPVPLAMQHDDDELAVVTRIRGHKWQYEPP
jgi:hypothetical protein